MTALILANGRQIKTIDDVRDYIEKLEETNLQLRQDLGLVKSSETVSRLATRWRLTNREAQLVQFLYARGGMTASKPSILDALYQQSPDEPEIKIVDVFICKIRHKMGADAITTEWGRGYRLSATGLKMVDAVLEMAPAELAQGAVPPAARPKRVNIQARALAAFVESEDGRLSVPQLVGALGPGFNYPQVHSVVTTLRAKKRIETVDWQVAADGRKRTFYAMTGVGRAYLRKNAAEL